jgi:hypothetical protein
MNECTSQGCAKPHYAKGWCNTHYMAHRPVQCAVEGCDTGTRLASKGLCRTHYSRLLTKGTTDPPIRETTHERFWRQVAKTDECWIWTGALRNGYGAFWVEGRTIGAHRWAYEHTVGPIPDGLTLDHTCHKRGCTPGKSCPHRACVNPSHLEPVTTGENTRRGAQLRSPLLLAA